MKDKTLEAMASQDAHDYGFAEMFFGEGAGTRRKLIGATVNQKMATIPGYVEKFDEAFGKLDQSKLAEEALKERRKIDGVAKAGKNFRALKSGNLHNLSNGVFVVVVVGYGLHMTGYDKVILEETKKRYRKAKSHLSVV